MDADKRRCETCVHQSAFISGCFFFRERLRIALPRCEQARRWKTWWNRNSMQL